MKWRLILVLLLAVAALLAAVSGINVPARTQQFVVALRSQGTLGLVWLALAYIPASVFCFPAALLTLAGGFAFGIANTLIAVSLGSTVGATAAFLVGRTLLRGFVAQRVANDARFRMLDAAVAEQGFKIVFLTRLSPVLPFNLLNYAFGVTQVRLRDFVLASWIGMFPGTLLYVSIGSAANSLSDLMAGRASGGVAQKMLLGVGLLATLAVSILLARIARRALAEAAADAAHDERSSHRNGSS